MLKALVGLANVTRSGGFTVDCRYKSQWGQNVYRVCLPIEFVTQMFIEKETIISILENKKCI